MTTHASQRVVGAAGSDPHCVCLDGSRVEAYHDGFLRLFEDFETGLCVNIGIENTYITSAAVVQHDKVWAHVHFDIDSDRQLHANHLNIVKENENSEDDEEPKVHCVTVGKYLICIEAMYRCVNVTSDDWRPMQTHRLGGLLAGVVFQVPTPLDFQEGPAKNVTLNEWSMNALCCDAHFPHTVSFFGHLIIPGPGENHSLFHMEEVRISSSMDHFSRVDDLTIVCGDETVHRCHWTRYASCMSPDQNNAPLTMLHVNDEPMPMRTHGVPSDEATRSVDHIVHFNAGGSMLVRMQANGSASFAIKDVSHQRLDHATGLLMERGAGTPTQPGTVTTATSSTYEAVLAPHLAWKKGQSAKRKWR